MKFIFDSGLVLYLPLFELDGSSFMSRDAYGHPCAVTGALWRPQGRQFDGVDDQIALGDVAALNMGTSDFSILAWIKCNPSASLRTILAKGGSAGVPIDAGYYLFVRSNGHVYIMIVDADTTAQSADDGVSVDDDVWHLIGATFDRDGNAIRYVDGNPTGTALGITNEQSSVNTTAHFMVGRRHDGTPYRFNGLIGAVSVFKERMLTPLEIQRHYLATKWRYR